MKNPVTQGHAPITYTRISPELFHSHIAEWLYSNYIEISDGPLLKLIWAKCKDGCWFGSFSSFFPLRAKWIMWGLCCSSAKWSWSFYSMKVRPCIACPELCSWGMYKVGIILKGGNKRASLFSTTALKKEKFCICLRVSCLKHYELQHELPLMQSAVSGNLFTRGNLELKLINTRDVLTVSREETFKLREV